jgi:hypothetical protein
MEDSSATLFDFSKEVRYVFDFPIGNAPVYTYLLSAALSQRVGLEGPRVVAVAEIVFPEPGRPVLYQAEGKYEIDRVIYDPLTEMYVIERGEGDFVFFRETIGVLGIIIGYCGPQGGIYDRLIFREIPPVCDR